jgi:cellulose synthase/poly-beta-1,6-N-acetylglucosamine synthase-like glycosyltransferase
MPAQRDIYDRRLTIVLPAVLAVSVWLAVATFLGMRYFGAGVVVATFYGVSTFFLSLSPLKTYAINTAAMLSRFTRGRWLHRVLQYEPVETRVYRNRPLAPAVAPGTTLTIMIPIYDEPFELIRQTSLETALQEAQDYGPLANLIVSDDGLMVFSDNRLPEFEAAARAKPEWRRTPSEREVIQRLDGYREILRRPDVRFGVVARPRTVPGRSETERRGTFKKGSNLNFTHQLADAVAALERASMSHEAALEAALTRRLGADHHRLAWARGEVATGDVVLLLDKDSTVPAGVSRDAVADFAGDPTLAYIQAATSPVNVADNYFARAVAYCTQLIYDFAFPLGIATGSNVPVVGHNVYIRMSALRGRNYWDEDRASEDYSFALDMAAGGWHGKYLDLTHHRFGEMVSRDIEEEMQRFARQGFGAAEIAFNPVRDWPARGVLSGQMKRFLASSVPWQIKVDVWLYLQTYFNKLLLLPLIVGSGYWPTQHVGLAGLLVSMIWSAAYVGALSSSYRTAAHPALAKGRGRHFAASFQYRLNVLASSYFVAKAILQFLAGLKPEHASTKIGLLQARRFREVAWDFRTTILRTAVLSGLFMAGAVLGYLSGRSMLYQWLSWYTFLSLVAGPFLLSPTFMRSLRAAFSRRPGETTPMVTVYTRDSGSSEMPLPLAPRPYRDLREFLADSDRTEADIRRSVRDREKQVKIALVVPTADSEAYIASSLHSYVVAAREATAIHPGWEFDLIVALNGARRAEAVEQLRAVQRAHAGHGLSILVLDLNGVRSKVHAMNAGIQIARQRDADLLGFVDDDVRFGPGALVTSLDYLLTDSRVLITGPRAGPVRPSAPASLFAELEAALSIDDSLPFGRGGQFTFTAYCPLIPDGIIHDDLYLDAYFARPDAPGPALDTVALAPGAVASWEPTGRLLSYLARYRRIRMGCRQLEEFFHGTKSAFLRRAMAASPPLRHRTSVGRLFAGRPTMRHVALIALVVYLWLVRRWTSLSVDLQIAARRLLGLRRYKVRWARR